jgi:hypothetical protein
MNKNTIQTSKTSKLTRLTESTDSDKLDFAESTEIDKSTETDNSTELFYDSFLIESKTTDLIEKKQYFNEVTTVIVAELADRITAYNTIMEESDSFQEKSDERHDLHIVLEAFNIIIERDTKKLGLLLNKTNNKEESEEILDQFKINSELLMKLLSYRMVI